MKKIEKVSIADISFALDNDACAALKRYLDSLRDHYAGDPDGAEIMADIEARIAELILNEQVYTKTVDKKLVDSIIMQLGTPEELGNNDDADRTAGGDRRSGYAEPSFPRRLYRSREGRILGGVCRGMAQFGNINVAWTRLAFLLPFVLFILTVPMARNSSAQHFFLNLMWIFSVIYVVLWFAIPRANSPRQILEMRGEKITPSSIRQNLQERAKTPETKKAASVFAEILAVFGRILLFFIKVVVAAIGFALLISAAGILTAIVIVFVNPLAFGTAVLPALAGMSILSPILFIALVLFCVMLPLAVLGVALLNLVFNRKTKPVFYSICLGVWLAAVIFCSVVAASNARYLWDIPKSGNFSIELRDHRRGTGRERNRNEYRGMERSGNREVMKLRGFLEKEDDGVNNIEINILGDSVEIVAWRDHTADSTHTSDDGVLKYRSSIVLKDKAAVAEAVKLRGKYGSQAGIVVPSGDEE